MTMRLYVLNRNHAFPVKGDAVMAINRLYPPGDKQCLEVFNHPNVNAAAIAALVEVVSHGDIEGARMAGWVIDEVERAV